jgi:hypothetical protein
MPLQATSGAASYDAFGGGVPVAVNYIEDVFSTYLYTGNATSRSINNGIDLLGKGGLLWAKSRDSSNSLSNYLVDTARGDSFYLYSEATNAQANLSAGNSFSNTGFNLSSNVNLNANTERYVSWTFRKQPKFFDVVTLNSSTTTYSHNLGSTPGCIIAKCTDASGAYWVVWHRSFSNTTNNYLSLNTTDAVDNLTNAWPSAPTSTQFSINPSLWANGTTGIAYLFAHDAGGFGLTGTDNVISCGSYTGNGSANGPTITLGYEPQWILFKKSSGADSWSIIDNMRGLVVDGTDPYLFPNSAAAEGTASPSDIASPTATGFQIKTSDGQYNTNGGTYIYIAIRRGPMKVPTSGTSVYTAGFATATTPWFDAGFPVDMAIYTERSGISDRYNSSRLLQGKYLLTNSTATEASSSTLAQYDFQEGYYNNSGASTDRLSWMFKRAPSFFDEVCYTGNSVAGRSINHNLDVAPEIIIVKRRSGVSGWSVYSAPTGNSSFLQLESVASVESSGLWANTTPTSDVFYVTDSSGAVNYSGETYVAYLFASCAGVSKVGSYTGTGTTLQIDCGFTAGARFVLIKRTDSNFGWYVWDSARGIVSGNDPYLLLNTTSAEVTNTDYIDTYSAGFEISSTAPAAINASGGSFIFFAVS